MPKRGRTINSILLSQVLLYAIVGAALALVVVAAVSAPIISIWRDFRADTVSGTRLLTLLLLYAPLGSALAAGTVFFEPWRTSGFKEAIQTSWMWLLLGILAGGLAMFLGGFLAEWIFLEMVTLGGFTMAALGRILGMLILGLVMGLVIGIVEKLRTKSNSRLVAGAVGGGFGGLLCGLVFEFLVRSPEAMTVAATSIFAAVFFASIGTVSIIQTSACLLRHPDNTISKYTTGDPITLYTDTPNYIGSALPARNSSLTTIKLAQDYDVASEHAKIEYHKNTNQWILNRISPEAEMIYVRGGRLVGNETVLQSGDEIVFGGIKLVFATDEKGGS